MGQEFQFCDFTLDQGRYRLQRGERVVRLEKRPMELLILLVERRGGLVSREEIAERLWGKDVFLDVDHGINTAVRKVRQALRDDPEKPRFVETVVGKGYRFAAPVVCHNDSSSQQLQVESAAPAPLPAQPTVESTQPRPISGRVWLVIVTAAILALVASAAIGYRTRSVKPGAQPAVNSIAVLPLRNLSGDPSQEYLADGMTEELIGRLSGIRGLRVISRTSVMGLKDTKRSVPEIAKSLNVDAIVEGSVVRDGNRIRVHAQLIRAATDEHFWSEEYDRELPDVLALQSDVAQSIAKRVEVTVTGQERSRLVAARPVAPNVYESYLRGLSPGHTKAEIEQSIHYFEDAIANDPTFAPAYVGLANAYQILGTIFVGGSPAETRPRAISAAQKALALDPNLSEPHVLLADIYVSRWQWQDAEGEYKRALELNPNSAEAHLGFSDWLVCQGRIEEALAWARRGRELDPLGDGDSQIAWTLIMAHRYEEAIREARSALLLHPGSASDNWGLGFALICNQEFDEAILVLQKAAAMTNRSPGPVQLLATAHARAGHRTEALRLINELKQRRQTEYVPAGAFINPYLGLSDYDQAFYWCEQAFKEQSNILHYLKVQPFFDPVRGDPRFQDLLRRVGLN